MKLSMLQYIIIYNKMKIKKRAMKEQNKEKE